MRGTCNICGWKGEFLQPQFQREGYLCGNCSASSRHRAIVHVLGMVLGHGGPLFLWEADKSTVILESSARGPYPVMLDDKYDYYATEFDPAKIAAGTDPRHFADFQRLHYADNTFDVVIASEVFEHVRDDIAGYREIFRTLNETGALILTVPYNHDATETIRRVDTTGREDVHLLEPEYHGGGGHTLTYRNYGRDLLTLLADTGFAVAHLALDVQESGITPQSVILASRQPFLDLHERAPSLDHGRSLGALLPFRMFLLFKYTIKGFAHYVRESGWKK